MCWRGGARLARRTGKSTPARRSCGHAPLMRSCEAEDDDAAACCAALFDSEAAGSAAAAAALARVPQRKGYADAAYWRSRYSAELAAAGDARAYTPYEWHVVASRGCRAFFSLAVS